MTAIAAIRNRQTRTTSWLTKRGATLSIKRPRINESHNASTEKLLYRKQSAQLDGDRLRRCGQPSAISGPNLRHPSPRLRRNLRPIRLDLRHQRFVAPVALPPGSLSIGVGLGHVRSLLRVTGIE